MLAHHRGVGRAADKDVELDEIPVDRFQPLAEVLELAMGVVIRAVLEAPLDELVLVLEGDLVVLVEDEFGERRGLFGEVEERGVTCHAGLLQAGSTNSTVESRISMAS